MPWGISHKGEWVFVHIPKTAGTSICSSWEGALLKEHCKKNGVLGGGHKTIEQIRFEYPETKGYKVWTVIRNPFDRFVSAWFYPKEEQARGYEPDPSFFNRDVFWPQVRWVDPLDTIFLRFENLGEDLKQMMAFLGIEIPSVIPHFRKSNRKDYRGYYSDELKKMVGEYYKDDFSTFGYVW